MARKQTVALLFEILRSYVTLARTLNLSRAVEELGTTRQTVRRHISLLEEAKGEPMFEVENRAYRLTEAGARALPEAEQLILRGEAWLENVTSHVDGLSQLRIEGGGGFVFYSQQHPIGDMWRDAEPPIQSALSAWVAAKGRLHDDAFAETRQSIMVYRPLNDRWIVTEIGETSSMATWFGLSWARSAIGRELDQLPGGHGFRSLLQDAFDQVHAGGGPRYEHVYTKITRYDDGILRPISYQRLLLGCTYPDDSFALATVVHRTRNISIDGVDLSQHGLMDEA